MVTTAREHRDPHATEQGTPLVYYSPAIVDSALMLTIEFGFRDFDKTYFERFSKVSTQASEMSPIRSGGGGELSYVIREATAVVVHLWQTRVDPARGAAVTAPDSGALAAPAG